MKLISVISYRWELLEHFLRHYTRYGVKEFHFAVPLSKYDEIAHVCTNYPVDLWALSQESVLAPGVTFDHSLQDWLREIVVDPLEWHISVDLDEFLMGDLDWSVSLAQSEGANVVKAHVIDRLTFDGSIPEKLDADIFKQFPVRDKWINKLCPNVVSYKACVLKGHLKHKQSYHEMHGEKPSSKWLELDHFKWHGDIINFMEKVLGQDMTAVINQYRTNGKLLV